MARRRRRVRLEAGRKVDLNQVMRQGSPKRAFSQSEKIRRRLRGKDCASSDEAIARKPKGMHRRTFDALLDRWEAYELECNLHFIRAAARLKSRRI